eukprot:3013048-Rhodomonas_salina.1
MACASSHHGLPAFEHGNFRAHTGATLERETQEWHASSCQPSDFAQRCSSFHSTSQRISLCRTTRSTQPEQLPFLPSLFTYTHLSTHNRTEQNRTQHIFTFRTSWLSPQAFRTLAPPTLLSTPSSSPRLPPWVSDRAPGSAHTHSSFQNQNSASSTHIEKRHITGK